MHIDFIGDAAIVSSDNSCFTYKTSENPRDFQSYRVNQESLDWKDKDYHIGNWRIHPYGDNNDLPKELQKVIQANSDAPGALKKKFQMLWGKGPQLYTEEIKTNDDGSTELVRKWIKDIEVMKWLDRWDYEKYLMQCVVDATYIEGTFTKFFINRGNRIGESPRIAKLENVNIDKTRLASRFKKKLTKPTHAAVTDFNLPNLSSVVDMDVYPLFDFLNPFAARTSIYYSNMYSFCMDYYTVPDIYGALEWLRRSNAIPIILKALSKNSINITYHVESPQEFWDQAKKRIKDECTEKKINYESSMLRDYETSLLRGVSKALSKEENTGKFWHTKKSIEIEGTNLIEYGWTITPIDQKIKDFVAAQISISQHATQKVSASVGVHSSLSNTGDKGKVDSGGEQYHALSNFLATGVDIPEMIVMKAINYALKINYPDKNLKLGFYHMGTKRLEQVAPKDRP